MYREASPADTGDGAILPIQVNCTHVAFSARVLAQLSNLNPPKRVRNIEAQHRGALSASAETKSENWDANKVYTLGEDQGPHGTKCQIRCCR